MRIFVTGLCLQGNKGGPALALSLRQRLEDELGDCSITLSVPLRDLERERRWAHHYGVEVVGDFALPDVIPPFAFRDFATRRRRVAAWVAAVRSADVMVELSAISYVGPPVGSTRSVLTHRFRYFVAAMVLRKRFVAWTQSYGPFTTRTVRVLARLDLRRQPVVFCRGDDCRDAVLDLVPNAVVESFPDVAATMRCDPDFGLAWLRDNGFHGAEHLVTISPSAVLYAKADGSGVDNRHVAQMADLARRQCSAGRRVLLVPHTLRPDRSDPEVCDAAVCRLVLDSGVSGDVGYVADDLAADELKAIIANATVHVGARYHSIVAALSSGVPCLSLSWHPKYRDIMRMYGMDDFVVAGIDDDTTERDALVDRLVAEREVLSSTMLERHERVAAEVQRNAAMFARLVRP